MPMSYVTRTRNLNSWDPYPCGSSLHAALQPQVSAKYEPIQTHNALNYIIDLLDDPDKHLDHAKR